MIPSVTSRYQASEQRRKPPDLVRVLSPGELLNRTRHLFSAQQRSRRIECKISVACRLARTCGVVERAEPLSATTFAGASLCRAALGTTRRRGIPCRAQLRRSPSWEGARASRRQPHAKPARLVREPRGPASPPGGAPMATPGRHAAAHARLRRGRAVTLSAGAASLPRCGAFNESPRLGRFAGGDRWGWACGLDETGWTRLRLAAT
jgi:hypothetical protein